MTEMFLPRCKNVMKTLMKNNSNCIYATLSHDGSIKYHMYSTQVSFPMNRVPLSNRFQLIPLDPDRYYYYGYGNHNGKLRERNCYRSHNRIVVKITITI